MTPIERVTEVIREHAYDHEQGECACGYRNPHEHDLAGHVATRVIAELAATA